VKFMRSLVVTGSLLVSAAAIAAAQQPAPTPAPGVHARKFARGGHPRQRFDRALFRGITLSDAEKTNIQAVHAKYASQMQTLSSQMRTEAQNAKAARQRGDTAALRSIRANIVAQRTQMMQAERNDLRGALSSQNQSTFDANVQKMQSRASKRSFRTGLKKP
jgi:Spy/CpxP family protein refolding chaperone